MAQRKQVRRLGYTLTRTFSPVLRFRLWLVPLVLGVLLLAGWWMRATLEQSVKLRVAGALQTLLQNNVTGLEIWLDAQKSYVSVTAGKSSVRELTERLTTLSRGGQDPASALLDSAELRELRAIMAPICEQGGYGGFVVTDVDGMFLASKDELIGTRTRFIHAPFVRKALAGEPVVSHPLTDSDQPPGQRDGAPFMAAVAPIYDDQQQLLGLLGLSFDPGSEFTRILQSARLAESGETYAFDADGLLISDSRFEDELREIGLLADDPEVDSVLNVEIRDPGGNMLEGFRPRGSRRALPLTRMAASAIAGEPGVDVDGYRDYRGVRVVGAWTWLSDYEFGLTSELDYDEALALPTQLRQLFWSAIGLLALVGGVVVLAMLVISRMSSKANRAIAQARQLGQYTLERKIGAGGMGEVYRASHALLRRPTAIKLLPPGRASRHDIQRFEREVQITAQLTHPNTIAIYDFGRTSDGVFYYAMEYLPGVDLDRLIELDGAQPAGRVIHILRQVCGSLAEAHDAALIHRDIKPGNVILCERGGNPDVAKLLDFGIVKNADGSDATLTAAGSMSGTPLYMAPESIRSPQAVDRRVDIYAVGVVGYYLLTGRELFEGGTLMEIYAKHLNEPPLPPSKRLGRAVPPDLEQVVLACLAKSADDRPATAQELSDALAGCADAGSWSQAAAHEWWDEHREAIAAGTQPNTATASKTSAAKSTTAVPRDATRTLMVDYVQRIGSE